MKKISHKGFRAFLLAAAALGAMLFWLLHIGPEVQVVVPRGMPASKVGALLTDKGVLRLPYTFRLLARLTHLDRRLKPGTYMMRQGMSSLEALYVISRGGFSYVKVVIPEGWRASQIAERLGDLGVSPPDAFLKYVSDREWEGYLFPTTYYLSTGMSPQRVAHLMHDQFLRKVGPALQGPLPPFMTPARCVVLASIVEREAVLAREKPLIAGVYLNRLKKHTLLEADPTVQYALGYWKKGLTYKDLAVDSPYNTYRYPGLPPGPIASPGLESVLAAVHPAPTDAMYFVADNTGAHVFNRSFEEHLKAKEKAKAERRRLRAQARRAAAPSRGEEDNP